MESDGGPEPVVYPAKKSRWFLRSWINVFGTSRRYLSWLDESGKRRATPEARVVCLAFHPRRDHYRLFCDHIDSDAANDSPENLRWCTRKENNRTEHARRMKSQHAVHTDRRGQLLVAERGEQRLIFRTGKECAAALGVSAPLVYRAASGSKGSNRLSRSGWVLRWEEI